MISRLSKPAGVAQKQAAAEIAKIGLQLNRLRIKRRIYDYIVEAV